MMPASAIKPIIDVAENGAPNSQWPTMMPTSVKGTGVSMTNGSLNEPTASADEPLHRGTDRVMLDSMVDEKANDPETECAEVAAERTLGHWLEQLTRQQQEVVQYRYGLNGHGRKTLEEVGVLLGVTRERVRQIQLAALARLRDISSREGYKEFPVIE